MNIISILIFAAMAGYLFWMVADTQQRTHETNRFIEQILEIAKEPTP